MDVRRGQELLTAPDNWSGGSFTNSAEHTSSAVERRGGPDAPPLCGPPALAAVPMGNRGRGRDGWPRGMTLNVHTLMSILHRNGQMGRERANYLQSINKDKLLINSAARLCDFELNSVYSHKQKDLYRDSTGVSEGVIKKTKCLSRTYSGINIPVIIFI